MKEKIKRKPLLFSFPLKTHNHPLRQKTQNTRRIHAEYTQNTRRIHAEYTENALKEMKEKMKRKPLLFSFPLKTQPPFKAKNAEYTQKTRRIHRECLKGGWVFLRLQGMGGRRGA